MTPAPEVLLFSCYATFLLGVALALDRLARHSHARSERYRTAGFRFVPHHDAWVCPQDQMLWPSGYDQRRGLVHYRAKASICNACPVKVDCTSSGHGREISMHTAPWPHSEAARFHRGIVLVLVVLAGLLASVAIARHHQAADVGIALVPLGLAGLLGHRLTAHFRRTPAGFPPVTASTGLGVAEPYWTTWGSDRMERR
jgi:hypothetical protein